MEIIHATKSGGELVVLLYDGRCIPHEMEEKKGNRRLPVVDPSSKNSCPSHWLFSLARPDPRQRVTLPPSTPPLPIPYIPRPIWTRERESMAVNSG
jgi:hypothetical protein